MAGDNDVVMVNRAPVLTLWAAVVAKHLGFDWDEALTLGKAVAGLNAQSKGRALGIFKPAEKGREAVEQARREAERAETIFVELCGRAVPARHTPEGIRAVIKGRPISPESVKRYLENKFGDRLDDVREAMEQLASAYEPQELARVAFDLYEQFRPEVPQGIRGWGAKGALRLDLIRQMAQQAAARG